MRLPVSTSASLLIGLLLSGCGGSDSATVRRSISQVSEGVSLGSLGVITAVPCAARVDADQDPDDIAPGMATSRLHAAVGAQLPGSLRISKADMQQRDLAGPLATFYHNWLRHPEDGDGGPLQRIALRLQAETVLVAGVLEWKQTDKYTRVCMVAGLFDASGRMLWWSEQERQAQATADHEGPPDFVTVVDSVVAALLESFPANTRKE